MYLQDRTITAIRELPNRLLDEIVTQLNGKKEKYAVIETGADWESFANGNFDTCDVQVYPIEDTIRVARMMAFEEARNYLGVRFVIYFDSVNPHESEIIPIKTVARFVERLKQDAIAVNDVCAIFGNIYR